jgi:hypothetical protein
MEQYLPFVAPIIFLISLSIIVVEFVLIFYQIKDNEVKLGRIKDTVAQHCGHTCALVTHEVIHALYVRNKLK